MKPISSLLSIALAVIMSCVEPVSLKITTELPKLVIYGTINNQDDSCVVNLSYTTNYLSGKQFVNNTVVPAIASKVILKDDKGNSAEMQASADGVYVTKSLKGKIGNTYTLHVEMPNGNKYESEPETLPNVPSIDSLNYTLYQDPRYYNGVYFTDISLKINSYFQDPPNEQNYYKWKWIGDATYVISTVIMPDTNSGIPNFCYYKMVPYRDDPYNQELNILNDKSFNGLNHNHAAVSFRFDSFDLRFRSGVNLLIAQYSLTQKAYQYWENLQKLVSGQGSIFEPTPFQVSGNIRNVADPSEKVFGYFGASGVRYLRYQFFVVHYKIEPCFFPQEVEFCIDCRKKGGEYSVNPPPYWSR